MKDKEYEISKINHFIGDDIISQLSPKVANKIEIGHLHMNNCPKSWEVPSVIEQHILFIQCKSTHFWKTLINY